MLAVSTIIKTASAVVFLLCLFSVVLWWLTGFAMIHPSISILAAFFAVAFFWMGKIQACKDAVNLEQAVMTLAYALYDAENTTRYSEASPEEQKRYESRARALRGTIMRYQNAHNRCNLAASIIAGKEIHDVDHVGCNVGAHRLGAR